MAQCLHECYKAALLVITVEGCGLDNVTAPQAAV
jgi:hypothetical protein